MHKKLSKDITSKLKKFTTKDPEINHEIFFIEIQPSSIIPVITILENDPLLGFKVLTDITAVDYPERPKRFELIYNLLSLKNNARIIVKTRISEEEHLDSISSIFSGAIWYEREIWDMFGVIFNNLHDHRRILTDYGFEGHPLRKDFPLTGYVEVSYDQTQGKVIYKPVELQQEFRIFDNLSPWSGSEYHIPTDCKTKDK